MTEKNQTINDEFDKELDEVIKTDDSKVEVHNDAIKLSSGVEFTHEELEGMDPALKAKLLKVKEGDANFAKGINAKVEEVKSLKAQIETMKEAKPEAPAPKADVETPAHASVTEAYLLQKMTEEKLSKSLVQVKALYGDKVTDLISAKIAPIVNRLVEGGQHMTNFVGLYSTAFAKLMTEDTAIFEAFNEFKGAKTAEAIAAEAEAKAKVDVLKSKQESTTGMPAGGNPMIKPPVEDQKPSSMAQAKALWKEKIKELKKSDE